MGLTACEGGKGGGQEGSGGGLLTGRSWKAWGRGGGGGGREEGGTAGGGGGQVAGKGGGCLLLWDGEAGAEAVELGCWLTALRISTVL